MMKTKNTSAFSIVIAMGLTLVMVLLVLFILEYIIPYSKNVKGIENATNAFYQSESAIEEGLYFFKTRSGTTSFNDTVRSFSGTSVDYEYATVSSGTLIPYNSEGNSFYSGSFNRISTGKPLQLELGDIAGLDFSSVLTNIAFNVPDINTGVAETLSGSSDSPALPIVNWQLSSSGNTLNATGSWIRADEIDGSWLNLDSREGRDLAGNEGSSSETFGGYYSNNCGSGEKCTLKFSIINDLVLDDANKTGVPYLEYKIRFNEVVPLRYSRIKSHGRSYGFQKSLEVRIPQQTTNEAFDFTVFQ